MTARVKALDATHEVGLCIGETTFGGLEDLCATFPGSKIDHGSLIWLTLQRASNAREVTRSWTEEAFAELQSVLEEQTEAENELHKLEDLDDGDADFDELVTGYFAEGHLDRTGAAFAYIAGIVESWKDRHKKLCDREL